MVLEVALIDVKPGSEKEFASAYGQAKDLVAQQGVPVLRRITHRQAIQG